MAKKKKLTDAQKKAKAAAAAKKMTVGKGLDMGAIGANAIFRAAQVMGGRPALDAGKDLIASYTSYNPTTNAINIDDLANGYGPALMRAGEKKAFQFLGIKGPRTGVKNIGDAIDYLTYFGKTGIEVWENRANPEEAARQAIITQYGVDMGQNGLGAFQPLDMITDKIAPYVLQKFIRKGLRAANIKMPKIGGMG